MRHFWALYDASFFSKLFKLYNDTVDTALCPDMTGIWIFEPRQDKTNNMSVRPAKTQISLGIRPVWSGSSLSAWRKLGSLATHWAHSEDSDQTGRKTRLIWFFAGRTTTLLVLSCRGSFEVLEEFWCNLLIDRFIWSFTTLVCVLTLVSGK